LSIDSLDKKVDSLKSGSAVRDWAPIATAAVSLLTLIASIVIAVKSLNRNAELTRRTLQQKTNDEEAKAIHQKLDEFYGPFSQLRGVSKLLYEIFRTRQPDPQNFNTLLALLGGKQFEGIDKVLLNEIMRVGDASEKLIEEKVGLVDDPDLQSLIWKLGAHYRVIRLASQGALNLGGAEFHDYKFPKEIDDKIAAQMRKLRARLEELRTVQ